jgi:hypothetical protein
MEVGQGPNWGHSAKRKKILFGEKYSHRALRYIIPLFSRSFLCHGTKYSHQFILKYPQFILHNQFP